MDRYRHLFITTAEFKRKFPVAEGWLTALSRGFGSVKHPRVAELSDVTSKEVINYLQKNKTAKQAMEDACRQIESMIQ